MLAHGPSSQGSTGKYLGWHDLEDRSVSVRKGWLLLPQHLPEEWVHWEPSQLAGQIQSSRNSQGRELDQEKGARGLLISQHCQEHARGSLTFHHPRRLCVQDIWTAGLWGDENQPCGWLGHSVRHADYWTQRLLPRLRHFPTKPRRPLDILLELQEEIRLRAWVQVEVPAERGQTLVRRWTHPTGLESSLPDLSWRVPENLQAFRHWAGRSWRVLLQSLAAAHDWWVRSQRHTQGGQGC